MMQLSWEGRTELPVESVGGRLGVGQEALGDPISLSGPLYTPDRLLHLATRGRGVDSFAVGVTPFQQAGM